jgi:phosphoesterase RecJ-like protein
LNNIKEIQPILKASKSPKVVITTHHKPDADALGSSLGLYNYLLKIGVKANVVTPTDYGEFLKWMPGESAVINFEEKEHYSQTLVEEADMIFCLDFNALKRINKLGVLVAQSKAIKVLIDHHLEPEGFEQFRLWTTKASSTCELVFWLIELMGDVSAIDEDIASCLYAGIMTDTASFKHGSTTATTHRVAATLLEKGAKSNRIFEAIYDNYSESRTRFIGFCLSEKLQILKEYNTALITVTAEDLKKFNIITGDSEGLVNFGLSITDIKLSVLIIDRTVARKMSFRSKDNFPANEFARKFFNGGGHFNAAGGESLDPIDQVEIKFKTALNDYKNYLI